MRFLTSFNLNAKEQLQLISGSFLSLCSSYSTKYKWARDLVEWRTKRKERDTKKNNSEKRASGMRASFSLCFLCAFLSFAGLISCFHYKLTKRKREKNRSEWKKEQSEKHKEARGFSLCLSLIHHSSLSFFVSVKFTLTL